VDCAILARGILAREIVARAITACSVVACAICHLRNTVRESSHETLSMSYIVKFFDITFDSSSTN
jgi:hypothetical protein